MTAHTNILFVVTKASWGGAQRYVFDMAKALSKDDFEVSVAFGTKGMLADKLEELHVPLYHINSLQRDFSFFADIKSFFSLYRIYRKARPDIVHLNSSKGGALGALAARMAGVPKIIFTVHGWAFNESRPQWQKTIITIIHWITVALSHKTITVSLFDYEQAKDWFLVGKKIVPIHNGIGSFAKKDKAEARSFLAHAHPTLPQHLNDIWIGTTSELHTNKGLNYLLRSFAKIAPTCPESIVVIVGAGEKRDSLHLLASDLGIAPRVFFLGFIENASHYLTAFDVFTLTSRKEGLPYAILEAGSAGLPVIASNIGGIPEIIESGRDGFLTRPGDTTALAEHLTTVCHDKPKASTIGAALQKKIESEFSLEKMLEETKRIYTS